MMTYSEFYKCYGDNFNIEAACPYYLPESQRTFTWHRDERGIAIVSGYDPEMDEDTDWLCVCGHYETGGFHCTNCGRQPPWGCDCSFCQDDDRYDEEVDFGYEFDPYDYLT
jgi:hypothetical protein